DSERPHSMGAFTFTPDLAVKYQARISGPGGVAEVADPFERLKIKAEGIALHVPDSVVSDPKPVSLVIRNQGGVRKLLMLTSCRGQIVDQQFVDVAKGPSEKRLEVGATPPGVLRISVYDTAGGELTPLAERLVFRAPLTRLEIAATIEAANAQVASA